MRHMIKTAIPLLLSLTLLGTLLGTLPGCTGAGEKETPSTFRVICTTPVAADLAACVCGELAVGEELTITNITQRQDMHSFEPSSKDMAELAWADVVICVGGVSEAWLEKSLKAVDKIPGENVVLVSMMKVCEAMEEQIPEGAQAEEEDDGTEVEYDEHIWTSLKNDVLIAEAIRDAMTQILPSHKEIFASNTTALVTRLTELEGRYEQMVQTAKRKCLVIADRYPFAYLFRDLGLTCYAAFPGCSSETNASFATQVFLVEKTREWGLPYIFTVDYAQGSVAAAVSRETGAGVLTLWSGQSRPESDDTYLDLVEKNLEALTKALN